MTDLDYYLSELKKLLPITKYDVRVLFSNENGCTNCLNVNKQSIKAINMSFEEYSDIVTSKNAIQLFNNRFAAIVSMWINHISKMETRLHIQSEAIQYLNCLYDLNVLTIDEYKFYREKLEQFIFYKGL